MLVHGHSSCSSTDECTQLLDGFGNGCDSDTPSSMPPQTPAIYDMVDEAEGYGCAVNIETTGEWGDQKPSM